MWCPRSAADTPPQPPCLTASRFPCPPGDPRPLCPRNRSRCRPRCWSRAGHRHRHPRRPARYRRPAAHPLQVARRPSAARRHQAAQRHQAVQRHQAGRPLAAPLQPVRHRLAGPHRPARRPPPAGRRLPARHHPVRRPDAHRPQPATFIQSARDQGGRVVLSPGIHSVRGEPFPRAPTAYRRSPRRPPPHRRAAGV